MLHFIYCYAECHYAGSRILFIIIVNVNMLSVAFYLLLYWMSLCWVSHFIYCYTWYHYAECCILFIIMLNVILLSVAFYLLLCWMSICWVSHFIYYRNECHAKCHSAKCHFTQCWGACLTSFNKNIPSKIWNFLEGDDTLTIFQWIGVH